MHNYRGEANPSTACRHPKKKHLRGKTGIQLIRPLFVVLIMGIFLLPFMGGQNSNPINSMFQHTYGGSELDCAYSMVQTLDGGFALVGETDSFGAGSDNMWLVKTDASGVMIWNQIYYDGTGHDEIYDLVQTLDGGFVLVGEMDSFGAGGKDMWLVKTDASGVMIWNHTYGGVGDEQGTAIIQTVDGGYALVGSTSSFGDGCDIWLVKTDANGVMIWNQAYGGTGHDEAHDLVQTIDGGYALAGYTSSFGAVRTESFGVRTTNMWLVKTDASGVIIWNQTYGNSDWDSAHSLVQTLDGGFTLVGETRSDVYLVKTNINGVKIWHQTYGGPGCDEARSLIQTLDGGFALVGETDSFGAGGRDMWLVKTDVSGNMTWHQTYGGIENDQGDALVQTIDGGFALAGYTESFGAGDRDMWLVKTDTNGTIQSSLSTLPSSRAISSSPPTPGWGPVILLVAIVVLTIWHRRKRK